VLEESASVVRAADVDDAIEMLGAADDPPALLVLAQRWPGEFSLAAVDRLRRSAPLAPVVGLLGSWCEGEARTGSPWPGVPRVYWHQWPAACRRELARLRNDAPSPWSLPATATDEERLLVGDPSPRAPQSGLAVVMTPGFAMFEWIARALRRRGLATAWLRPGEPVRLAGATAGLFDTAQMDAWQSDRLRRFTQALGPVPVLALVGFPRVEDRDRALAAGAAAVLAKPFLLEDLDDELDRLSRQTR